MFRDLLENDSGDEEAKSNKALVAYEFSDPSANVWAPYTDNDSINPLESFHKNVFLEKVSIEMYYTDIVKYLLNLSWL